MGLELANAGMAALEEAPVMARSHSALLAEAIIRAIDEIAAAQPKITAPDRPLPIFRDMTARHRAGAVGVLLGAARTPSLQAIGANLKRLAGDSPLASARFANAERAAKKAAEEIAAARASLIEDFRKRVERPRLQKRAG